MLHTSLLPSLMMMRFIASASRRRLSRHYCCSSSSRCCCCWKQQHPQAPTAAAPSSKRINNRNFSGGSIVLSSVPGHRRRQDDIIYGCWRQRHFSTATTTTTSTAPSSSSSTSSSGRGLFSIPELRRPSDFARMASAAMTECDRLRSSLSSSSSSSSSVGSVTNAPQNVLYTLDEISKTVCNVIDAAELARSVHADPAWREAANRAFALLADYMAQLNSDPALYAALRQVTTTNMNNNSSLSLLTEEEQRFAVLLQAEFERDGIHLPDPERERVRQIQNHVTELESLFSSNLVHNSQSKTFLADAASVEAVLPRHVLHAFGMERIDDDTTGDGQQKIRLSATDSQITQSLIKYSTSPELRKQVYIESNTTVPENLPVLDALVRQRHELARALGFASYAHRFLSDKMARNPQTVQNFLYQLQAATQPLFQKEMQLLSQAKQRIEPNNGGVLEPWDIAFYVGLLKARRQEDSGGLFDDDDIHHSVSQYLTIHNCLEGMKLLVKRLFGIEMQEEEMTEDERWDGGSAAANADHRVRRFVLFHNDGESLGTMYLDLYPREGKYGHAAHFTVRCGCVVNNNGSSSDGHDGAPPPEYQLPIVALVCNLSAAGATSVLTHAQVETLFHEFGHALHSLLSRTKFQHMSGTRAAMDFVETPSHLIENFVWDAEFLKLLAFHHATGEAIPDAMIQQLIRSRYEFSAIERQNQIIYALFDQKLFGSSPPDSCNSTMELFSKLHRDFGVPYAENTHWYSRFGHLVTYGAGYYGYLYSQVFAEDIWKQCFEGNSLNRESGDRLWKKMLIHGGAKDPAIMLTDLLGRPPKVGYFVEG